MEGGDLKKRRKAISAIRVTILLNETDVCQPRLFPNLPKTVNDIIEPKGIAVLNMPIAMPSSFPLNHWIRKRGRPIARTKAPTPETVLPKARCKNVLPEITIRVPIIIKIKQLTTIFLVP